MKEAEAIEFVKRQKKYSKLTEESAKANGPDEE